MAVTRNKFSNRQAGPGVAVDVLALSPQARRHLLVLGAGQAAMTVQNTTKELSYTAAFDHKIVSIYVNQVTAQAMASGTSAMTIDRVATDGTTDTAVVASATVLGKTANVAYAPTLAATNPAEITAGQTVRLRITTSNNTVDTADEGWSATFLLEAVEDAVISDTDARGA